MVKDKKPKKDITTPAKKPKKKRLPIPALFFIQNSIDYAALEKVKKVVKTSPNGQIYLVVKSFGGDAYTAVRIIKNLRTKYKNIIGVVPEYAYSATTLMLLGTSQILVSPEGYIGPIDKPTEHDASGEGISTLDVTQSMPTLASLVLQQAESFYNTMRSPDKFENTSKKDALNIAWRSAVSLTCPLVEKIDPVLLQKSYRDLRIGLFYGIDLLYDDMLKGQIGKASRAAEKLVGFFPSHGYAIFREEMKMIGLSVDKFEKCKDFDKLNELYGASKSGIIFVEDIYA